MFGQHFLGSGLSIPELFVLEGKSHHDSTHRCCPARDLRRISLQLSCAFGVGKPPVRILKLADHLAGMKPHPIPHPSCLPRSCWGCRRLDRLLPALPHRSQVLSWPKDELVAMAGVEACVALPAQRRAAARSSSQRRLLLHNSFLLFLSHSAPILSPC